MRLWELEEGDGDDVGIGFAGGMREREIEIPPEDIPEGDAGIVAAVHADDGDVIDIPEIVEPPDEPPPELQREGPLVLRINQLPPIHPPAPAVPDPPLPVGNRRRGPQRQGPRNAPGPGARRQVRGNQQPIPRNGGRGAPVDGPEAQEAVDRAWIQMFVQMAMNDEEDQLEDDEADAAAWEIPVR
jgi:E3 ubiquitin-protein ligase RNF14